MTAHHVVSIEEDQSSGLPTSYADDTTSMTSGSSSTTVVDQSTRSLLPWKILCLVLVLLVTLGWICVIVLLILKEEWQLVMVSWLLLYAGGHFCYWYFKRNSSRGDPNASLSQRIMARLHGEGHQTPTPATQADHIDPPPSYDELLKSELPPPAYHCIVRETPKLRRVLLNTLPWFLRKKALEGASVAPQQVTGCKSAPISRCSSAGELDYQNDDAWKVSGGGGPRVDSIVVADVPLEDMSVAARQLQQLQAARQQPVLTPVLTPIHQALAALPSTVLDSNSQRATIEN